MKKEMGLLLLAMSLTGCVATSDSSAIGASRGVNPAMLSEAEFKQYQMQRANEVYEAETQAAKKHAALQNANETMSTVRQGIDTLRQIKNFFR
ncbi:MAG: hypothetical protein KGV56_04805 [Gammaproteobacteria bacterium]|nr:hypothetical protein [Gammaproteobacteria bacterium]